MASFLTSSRLFLLSSSTTSRMSRAAAARSMATSGGTGGSEGDAGKGKGNNVHARNSRKHARLGQTSVFVQSGFRIRELPLVVQKVNDVLRIGAEDDEDVLGGQPAASIAVDEEAAEVMSGFDRCFSTHGIFKLLETIPAEEVTPPVAVHALKKIINLENSASADTKSKKTASDSFLRQAFINMLLDIVYHCRDPRVILEGLNAVSRDTFPREQSAAYKERMCDETLVCISEGHFSLEQICEAVVILSDFYPDKKKCFDVADQLWAGIMDKSDKIDADNIAAVFSTLPHLRASRDIVYKMLEAKMGEFWQMYTTKDVLEILGVFVGMQMRPNRVLQVITQWLTVNVHSLSEGEMLAVIYCLQKLEYIDDAVIRTMEKTMKVRGVQIKERDLVATICDYCLDFGVRSTPILEGAGEYFIEHGMSLSVPQLHSITRIFGELHFHPPNGFKFFEILEHVLEHKFLEFPPKEILDLLLSFIYIERYPLNFVRKIFNPYFMDRLHKQSEEDVAYSRRQLHLFDAAMNIESKNYTGPYLPKDKNYKRMIHDHRKLSLAKSLIAPLGNVVGDLDRISYSVVLSSLPLHTIYIIDLMVYPSRAASLMRFGAKTANDQLVAVIIHMPEHFVRGRMELRGVQAMRIRHLKKMGFKVMEVEEKKLSRRKMDPEMQAEYLSKMYYGALNATKSEDAE